MKRICNLMVMLMLVALLVTTLPFSSPSPAEAATTISNFELAKHWAPIWYQDTDWEVFYCDDGDPMTYDYYHTHRVDYITNFDFDENWSATDNWENLEAMDSNCRWRYPLKAYIYYWVVETESNWYVGYADFHPRDWGPLPPTHENDMEGCLLVIRRNGSDWGEFERMVTQYHGSFRSYPGPFFGQPKFSGDHPLVYVEDKGHGVYANDNWEATGFPGGDGIRYDCSSTAVEPAESDNWGGVVGYELKPIDELWDRRDDRNIFLPSGGFAAADQQPGANPPWCWYDGSDHPAPHFFAYPAYLGNEALAKYLHWSYGDLLPQITTDLEISPGPYYVGKEISATFTVSQPPEHFDPLGVKIPPDLSPDLYLYDLVVGGRGPGGDTDVQDFEPKVDVTLLWGDPVKDTHTYSGTFTPATPGNYHFFCAYRTLEPDGWITDIPAAPGVCTTADITVMPSPDIYPDLTVTSVTAPTSATPGGYIAVSWTVRNNGGTSSGSFWNRISLATTPWGTDVASLGYFSMASIAPKSTLSDARVVQIPVSVPLGNYYVTVYADALLPPNGVVAESNEMNNIGSTYPQTISITSSSVPPVAPSNLTATPISTSRIDLSWQDNSGNETGFRIERKTGAGGTYSPIVTLASNITTYSNTGLSQNTTYYYRVRAYNAAGDSTYSNEAYAKTSAVVPLPPSNLAATPVSMSQINLTWQDNSYNESGFKIEQKIGAGGTYSQIDTVGSNVTTYSNAGLVPDTTYYYRVRAYNADGDSTYSDEAYATTSAMRPLPPGNLVATAVSRSQINLTWKDDSYNESGFKIERKTGAGGTYSPIATVGINVTNYANYGLSENTNYCYQVRSYNADGDSPYCIEACATTLTPPSIGYNPSSFSFVAIEGRPNPSSKTLRIWDAGGEPLHWSVSDDAPWLSLNPQSDTAAGETDSVTVSVDISGMTAGDYSATIEISAPDAGNSPRTVTVSLTIYPRGSGEIFHVPGDFASINQAVSYARMYPGSTVLVAPGTYTESVRMEEDVNLVGEDKNSTIIVAPSGSDYAVLGADNARISGFTISGGLERLVAVRCGWYTPSSPEISDNIITSTNCAIAVLEGSSAIIRNNTITGVGDAIEVYGGSPVIENNLICHNNGTGVDLLDGSSATIINNVIDSVGLLAGYGIYFYSASDSATIKNNIFANLDFAIVNPYSSTPSLSYNDFFMVNTQYVNGEYWGPANGVGDLSSDPLFVNQAAGDYHLADGSPCIDAGDPTSEYYDAYFPPSKGTQRNDMGAYGGPWAKFTTEPRVTIWVPNGGEQWEVGSHYDIVWTAVDDIAVTTVDIFYSTDGGATYPNVIATGGPNDGIYTWTPPDTCSDSCKVKIVGHDNQGNTGEDVSDSNFAIVPSQTPPQGTEVSGTISTDTTWSATGSPYIVTDDVTIDAETTLTIEPGVTVRFYPHKALQIDGELIAIGTDLDQITFTSDRSTPAAGDWGYILYTDSSIDAMYDGAGTYLSGSIMQFCTIEYGGQDNFAALSIESAASLIDHCTISNNAYGGMYVDHGAPKIANSKIAYNSAYIGGGIYLYYSTVVLAGNTITYNSASMTGGGIYGGYSEVIITDNVISHNSATSFHGGISLEYGTGSIVGNIISNNTAVSGGGIVVSHTEGSIISHNTITGNSCSNGGAAIIDQFGASTISYNEITGNICSSNDGGAIYILGQSDINHNNLYGNTPYDVYNNNAWDVDATNNWWGTCDQAIIAAHIYDGADGNSLGIVYYNPWLTAEINLSDTTPPHVLTVADDGYYTSSTSQLHASWVGSDDQSGIAEYQYAIGTSPGGDDTIPWTSAGTNTEVTAVELNLSPGTTYYFAVKAMNGAGLWSVAETSDGITVDTTPPSTPAVIDSGDYAWSTSELYASWSAADDESAIADYQFAVGTSVGSADVVDWTSVGMDTEATATGLNLNPGSTYFFSVKARNGAGIWSDAGISDGIAIDNTPPSTPAVVDDGGYTSTTTELHATWSASDLESGVAEYRYAIGTSAGGAEVIGWTSAGMDTGVIATGLSLSLGTTYYFAVQAKNGAGLWSDVGTSDGIMVVQAGPTVTSVTPNQGIQGQVMSGVIVAGANFTADAVPSFGPGITVNSFTVDSLSQITANITIDPAADSGARSVSVTTLGGTGTLTNGFTVIQPDVNGDGRVNVLDMIRVGQHFGEIGLPGWIAEDVNCNGIIDTLDLNVIAEHWTG